MTLRPKERVRVARLAAQLRATSNALFAAFIWYESPEGYDYWKAQADHLEALAAPLEGRLEDEAE